MSNIALAEHMSLDIPKATSSPQSSPKMTSNNRLPSALPFSKSILHSPERQKPKHLSEFAMPSPVSTPGAEHLSDVSSCCSLDDTDSNRSSPPDSPRSNSFSTPASDLKRKYKKYLWSAISSDYHYLMDEEIIDTCRSTESDLSFESDDQTASFTVVTFKDFMQQYNELNNWLGVVLQRAQRHYHCLSEKYVNQTFHEDMLNHQMSLQHFKDCARQLILTNPGLKEDISHYLKQVNAKWEALERLVPNANHSGQKKMLHDMELDFDGLRLWVDEMEVKRRTWRLHSHWSNDDINEHLGLQRILQAQIESHSKVVRALLSLCGRSTGSRDGAETGLKADMEEQHRALLMQEQVTDIQDELHNIWLNSIEWQMTLEDAKKNGIHIRHNAEDDQWDRTRSTGQRRQEGELATVHELSSDFVSDEDSFFHNHSLRKKKSESENESNVKNDDADVPANEFFSDTEAEYYGLPGNAHQLQVPVDYNARSYSDPLLSSASYDGQLRGGNGGNPAACKSNLISNLNPGEADDSSGRPDDNFDREWSPGRLRRCGAIDLAAAFAEEKKDLPVDVGYSSGSHSNEETDSSARQEIFIWLPSQNPQRKGSDEDYLVYMDEDAAMENLPDALTDRCEDVDRGRVEAGVFGVSNPSAEPMTRDARCLEAADELSLPETEDEMSVELPLDEVPVVRSSDLCTEDLCGPLLKRPLGKTAAFRRNLRFVEDSSTSDFDSWPLSKLSSPKTSPKKKLGPGKLEHAPNVLLKGESLMIEALTGVRKKKTKLFSNSTPLSGSCYASSEGTESESDLINRNLRMEGQEKKFGRRLRSRWNGSSSLRSSPVKEVVEMSGGRSPLKRRLSEGMENAFGDRYGMNKNHLWMSDSAISELLRDDMVSPKIAKMSVRTADFANSRPMKLDGDAYQCLGRLKTTNPSMQKGVFNEPTEEVLSRSLKDRPIFLGAEDDAVVPCCDSLNSSFTELTADDSQMYSDHEKIDDDEMQWHDDRYYGDSSERDWKESSKARAALPEAAVPRHRWLDSDSDMEDFQNVLNESRKGLKFIEATIRQDCSFGENDISSQDSTAFNEPLATCNTNIICLEELIDALRSKNKMDGEIFQVTEIVGRWHQLQSSLVLLQREAQRISKFQAEITGIQLELQSLNAIVTCDLQFQDIHQLEETLKAIKAVRFELGETTDLRLQALDAAFEQLASDHDDLDPQLLALNEQKEQLKKFRYSFAKWCEANERKLQSALISWHRFNCMEKELNSLLQECNLVSAGNVAKSSAEAGSEETNDLEAMKTNWKLLDEKLQRLSLIYLDFASLCSDSSALALKQAIMLSSNQLQLLRHKNDEKLMRLVKAKNGSPFPAAIGHQVANSQVLSGGFVPNGTVSPVNSTSRPVKYVLPLALAFALVSCLYALFGDSWYELLGTLGLILDPNLQHIRGPPPS